MAGPPLKPPDGSFGGGNRIGGECTENQSGFAAATDLILRNDDLSRHGNVARASDRAQRGALWRPNDPGKRLIGQENRAGPSILLVPAARAGLSLDGNQSSRLHPPRLWRV